MKNVVVALLLLCFACDESPFKNSVMVTRLTEIRANGKVQQTFEYTNDLLVQENVFGVCTTHPSDEFEYSYSGNDVSALHLTMRGIYSNLSSACDPTKGLHATETYVYNNNVLAGISRDNSQTMFTYNSQGFVEKQVVSFAQGSYETTYTYDLRGNLISETDADGNVTSYMYDDQKNPYYHMNQRPGWISPFNKSPNNVIRASGHHTFERAIIYNAEGFPSEITEDNGITYIYVY